MASEDDQYHPKDSVKAAINGTMVMGAAGGLVSAIQNTLTRKNVNAWSVFTRTGGTIVAFGTNKILECASPTNNLISGHGRYLRIRQIFVSEPPREGRQL
jgi:hypothetical protein